MKKIYIKRYRNRSLLPWRMADQNHAILKSLKTKSMIPNISINLTTTKNQIIVGVAGVKGIKKSLKRSISKFRGQPNQVRIFKEGVLYSLQHREKVKEKIKWRGRLAALRENAFRARPCSRSYATARSLNRWMCFGKSSDRTRAKCRLGSSVSSWPKSSAWRKTKSTNGFGKWCTSSKIRTKLSLYKNTWAN